MSVNKIMVVDDDRLLREFYARIFENMECETVCAEDGDQALELLRNAQRPFSLVLMDLLMPVRTGWETIEFIRNEAAWANLPIIAITGLAVSGEELQRLRKMCDHVILKKEFDLTAFRDTVERLLKAQGPSS